MKLTVTVCALTLSLAVPVASRCAAAAVPQQDPNRVAQLTVECKKANYASCNSLGLMYEEGDGVAKEAKRRGTYRRACDGDHANGC
jgi:TPR repeat protein